MLQEGNNVPKFEKCEMKVMGEKPFTSMDGI